MASRSSAPATSAFAASRRPFPRVQRLATNVYTFEQVDPTKRTVTVNNLIVAGEDGVLVAEGQGTEANVRKLIDAVRTITPAPVRYVVVGSEHGDHTGGDLEVYVPSQQVLFMSEVSSNRIFPSTANGYPREWIETLKKAEQLDAAWLVMAGRAPRTTRSRR